MPNIRDYTTFTDEALAELDENLAKSAKGGDFLKLEEGTIAVRILPGHPGKSPFRVIYQHYVDMPDGTTFVCICPKMQNKQPCAVCEHARELERSPNPNEASRAKIDRLYPATRTVCNVVVRGREHEGPRKFAMSAKLAKKVKDIREKYKGSKGDFLDPFNGFDLLVSREGTGMMDTKYDAIPERENTPLLADPDGQADEAAILALLEQMEDLDEVTRTRSVEDVQQALAGQMPTRNAARSLGTPPAPPSRALSSTSAPKAAPPVTARPAVRVAPTPVRAVRPTVKRATVTDDALDVEPSSESDENPAWGLSK